MTITAVETEVHHAVKGGLQLEVTDVTRQTESIVSFTFADPSGAPLPSYVPGSHLVVQCGEGANAYSLTGSGTAPSEYTISVLQVEGGSGVPWRCTGSQPVTVLVFRFRAVLLHLRQQPGISCWLQQESE